MQITCYTNFSKKPNSTKQPAGGTGTTKTVTLKQPTSIIRPVFQLTGDTFTYNYIKWDNRYYFVDDIISVHKGLTEYHCTVDPLASWKTEIGSSSEFVTRAYLTYDSILPDHLYPVQAGYSYTEDEIDITTGIVPESGMTVSWDNTDGCYVVGVVGETPASGSIGYYVLSASQFSSLVADLFSTITLDTTTQDIAEITQKQLLNPFQYIVSCNWFPFSIATGASLPVKFGWWTANTYGYVLTRATRSITMNKSITLTAHPEAASRGGYLNTAPFTQRTLYAYSFGAIPLDSMDFVRGRDIDIQIAVDLFTGNAKLDIYGKDVSNITARIARRYAQMCAPVQLAQLVQNVVSGRVQGMAATALIGAEYILGVEHGISSAAGMIPPQVSVQGSTGSNIDFYGKPRVTNKFAFQSPMDDVHNGRPLCQQKTISTLSGFIQCQNADVEIPGTQFERDEIIRNMNGGFYYE